MIKSSEELPLFFINRVHGPISYRSQFNLAPALGIHILARQQDSERVIKMAYLYHERVDL